MNSLNNIIKIVIAFQVLCVIASIYVTIYIDTANGLGYF